MKTISGQNEVWRVLTMGSRTVMEDALDSLDVYMGS